jgi:hypothetical protein
MPSRNDSCPCGSGAKYKRCCLVRLDAVACELRERAAFVGNLTAWLKDEHEQEIEEAGSHTTLIRILRGAAGRGMSAAWAFTDYRPADGGAVLIERYATRPELSDSERAIARGLAGARLDAYRVGAVVPGVCIELESLSEGTSARVGWRDGYEHFALDEIVVVRVVRATSLPTLWGPGTRFPAGVELRTRRWTIEDDDAVLAVVEDDEMWEGLGQALPDGWAFAWLDDAESGATDLGGWRDEPGEIEAARLIVCERDVTLLSADPRSLREIGAKLEASVQELITARDEPLAA